MSFQLVSSVSYLGLNERFKVNRAEGTKQTRAGRLLRFDSHGFNFHVCVTAQCDNVLDTLCGIAFP